MLNLLPPEEKEQIRSEARVKVALIICFLLLFFFISFISVLFFIKYYSQNERNEQELSVRELQDESKLAEMQIVQKRISDSNRMLDQLDSFYGDKIYYYKIIEKISCMLPEDSYFESLSIGSPKVENDKKVSQISISGHIVSRESLFDFKKALEKDEAIKEVVFPPSDWTKSSDIDFQATFKLIN